MKNSDCLFSDIQNLYNAVSDWLIQKINNPIETNETIQHNTCNGSQSQSGFHRIKVSSSCAKFS